MKLREYNGFTNAKLGKMFSGLKVRTTSGKVGYLQYRTKSFAVITHGKCSPNSTCNYTRIADGDFEFIDTWDVLEINSVPVASYYAI